MNIGSERTSRSEFTDRESRSSAVDRGADRVGERPNDRPNGRRRVGRVAPVASGRALLGAALVTMSVIGLYIAWRSATKTRSIEVVVAARPIAAGSPIEPDMLRVERFALQGNSSIRSSFSDPSELAGVITLGPLKEGEIVQPGALVRKLGGPATLEVGLRLPRAAAVNGALKVGDRVDVFVADSDDRTSEPAQMVIAYVPVVRTDSPDVLGSSTETINVTIGVESRTIAAAVVGAAAGNKISLVRSTGVNPDGTVTSSGTVTSAGTVAPEGTVTPDATTGAADQATPETSPETTPETTKP
jgi:Flp pilus assembly protein CpaB